MKCTADVRKMMTYFGPQLSPKGLKEKLTMWLAVIDGEPSLSWLRAAPFPSLQSFKTVPFASIQEVSSTGKIASDHLVDHFDPRYRNRYILIRMDTGACGLGICIDCCRGRA
jgi:hypothetical protein